MSEKAKPGGLFMKIPRNDDDDDDDDDDVIL